VEVAFDDAASIPETSTRRAVRASKIYEGTNDIQRLVISRALIDETQREKRV
jgi:alkylation response protein AidB-like acyl-CoA dehydrogenase